MLDMHNHILYGVDDGSKSLEESVRMAKMFVESGYTDVITTSHFINGSYEKQKPFLQNRLNEITQELNKQHINLNLYLGNELYYESGILDLLKEGRIATLANSNYILLEFSFNQAPYGLNNSMYMMQLAGYTPIFAHVERYKYVQENPDWLKPYIDQGAYIQCNLECLSKPESKDYKTILDLLNRGYVHLFGTDAHQSEWRSPMVKPQLDILQELLTKEAYQTLLIDNPYAILHNEDIETPEKYLKIVPKVSFLTKIKKKFAV